MCKTMANPKIDIVTQKEAKKDYLIIGIQFGFLGYVVRLGFYRQYCKDN